MDLIKRFKSKLRREKKSISDHPSEKPKAELSKNDVILENRTINVGIDLGTHSTKVIYQIIEHAGPDAKNAYVFDFGTDLNEYPPYTYPSLVTINNGQLFFGDNAYQNMNNAEAKFTSFKMCVACYWGYIPCKSCQRIGSSDFLRGEFSYNGLNLNAYEVAIFYLAYVLKMIHTDCLKKYQDNYQLTFYYNVSFPLNYLEIQKKRRYFEWLILYAEEIKSEIFQGINLKDAKEILNQSSLKNNEFPREDFGKTFTVAETRAAMHSIVKTGYYDQGIYAIYDIGAGTSDISFFRNGKNKIGEEKFSFYVDQSHNIGGDDFDWILFSSVKNKLNNKNIKEMELIYAIREAKKKMIELNEFKLDQYSLGISLDSVVNICIGNLNQLRKYFEETLKKAFKKEEDWKRWENINLILIGGGSRFYGVRQPLSALNIQQLRNWEPVFKELRMADNIDLSTINEYEFEENYHYFYTAHGLSYFIEDITEAKFPDEVKFFRPTKTYREFVDAEDQYSGMPDRRIEK